MSLKGEVREYLAEIADDHEQEEVDEISNIIETYDEDMSNLSVVDRFIIGRLIDTERLSDSLDLVTDAGISKIVV